MNEKGKSNLPPGLENINFFHSWILFFYPDYIFVIKTSRKTKSLSRFRVYLFKKIKIKKRIFSNSEFLIFKYMPKSRHFSSCIVSWSSLFKTRYRFIENFLQKMRFFLTNRTFQQVHNSCLYFTPIRAIVLSQKAPQCSNESCLFLVELDGDLWSCDCVNRAKVKNKK